MKQLGVLDLREGTVIFVCSMGHQYRCCCPQYDRSENMGQIKKSLGKTLRKSGITCFKR